MPRLSLARLDHATKSPKSLCIPLTVTHKPSFPSALACSPHTGLRVMVVTSTRASIKHPACEMPPATEPDARSLQSHSPPPPELQSPAKNGRPRNAPPPSSGPEPLARTSRVHADTGS